MKFYSWKTEFMVRIIKCGCTSDKTLLIFDEILICTNVTRAEYVRIGILLEWQLRKFVHMKPDMELKTIRGEK